MSNFTWRTYVKQVTKALWLGVILNFCVTPSAFGDQWGVVWGIGSDGDSCWYREGIDQNHPMGTSWTNVGGDIMYVSVSPTGQVYGYNSAGNIWYRSGITQTNPKGTGWVRIDGPQMIKNGGVAAGPNGQVWGVSTEYGKPNGNIYLINDATPSNPAGSGWKQVDSGSNISFIAVGPSGIPIGIQNDTWGGRIWWRLPNGWTPAEGGALQQISIGLSNSIWGVNGGNNIFVRTGTSPSNVYGNGWAQIDGGLKCVSVGARGAVWGVNSANQIWYRNGTDSNPQGTGWTQLQDGALVQIAVGPWISDLPLDPSQVSSYVASTKPGVVWGVNSGNQVWYTPGTVSYTSGVNVSASTTPWQEVTGKALSHVTVGHNGVVYGIGTDGTIVARDQISQANPAGTAWVTIAAPTGHTPSKIFAGPNGQTWLTCTDQTIYYRTGVSATAPYGTGWLLMDGGCVYVGLGADGSVICTNAGGGIYSRTGISAATPQGTGWQQVPGGLVQISGGVNGNFWGANSGNECYYKPAGDANGNWTDVGPNIRYVAAGPTGMVWAVDPSGNIYFRYGAGANNTGSSWFQVNGGLVELSVGPAVSSLPVVPMSVVPPLIPSGWYQEGEAMEIVAVGSENGETMAWALQIEANAEGQKNGALFQFQSGSMDPNPWKQVTANDASGNAIEDITDVAAASDGTVCIVSGVGQVLVGGTTTTVNGVQTTTGGTVRPTGGVVYQYDEKANHWVALPSTSAGQTIMFETVAVGNKNNIWATQINSNNLYQLVNGAWVLRSTACTNVAVGFDGTVYAINTTGNVYEYVAKSNGWSQIMYKDASGAEHPLQLTQISVGSADYAYGINNISSGNTLWWWNKATKNWEQPAATAGNPAGGMVTVSCNAAGTVMASDNDYTWMDDLGGVNAQGKPSGKISARTAAEEAGKLPKVTPASTTTATAQAAKVEKAKKKLQKSKATAAAVRKAKKAKVKTVDKKGKATTTEVKVDSTNKVIPAATKVVGKKAREAKIAKKAATAAATTGASTAGATTAVTPGAAKKPAKAKRAAKATNVMAAPKATKAGAAKAMHAKPGNKPAMVRK